MITINHVSINVLDLEKSLKFYKEALDLTPKERMEAPDGSFILVFLRDGVSDFALELTWLRAHTEPYDLGEGEAHVGFVTDAFDDLHKKHSDMGIICLENETLGIYFIEDPDGYWLEIVPKH